MATDLGYLEEIDGDHHHARLFEPGDRGKRCLDDFGFGVSLKVADIDAEVQAANALGDRRQRIGNLCSGAEGIAIVMAGDCLVEQAHICHRSRERANMIKGGGEGMHTAPTDPAEFRLESNDTVHGARKSDRTARVGSEGAEAERRRNRPYLPSSHIGSQFGRRANRVSGPSSLV
jgi:hypothetical protein